MSSTGTSYLIDLGPFIEIFEMDEHPYGFTKSLVMSLRKKIQSELENIEKLLDRYAVAHARQQSPY